MRRLILVTLALLAAIGVGALAAQGLDPDRVPSPPSTPCRVTLRAYEDGSANLYCEGRAAALGRIDAESGRLRIAAPR